ncbi:hypothetical protein [Stenotrophomonas muris]|uniref:hypothetical protein n=1 Tax=Stenotrophomonas muris TaxID=2963283 RepID=UPI0039C5C8C7
MGAYENGNALAHPAPHVWAERWEMIEKIKECEGGLTKRELFAAMAMQGIRTTMTSMHTRYADVADMAVCQADALLDALEKGK